MSKRNRCYAEMVPDDLLVDNILSRLPTKSLRRFRCVSKRWGNLISHVFSQRKTLLPVDGLLVYPDPHVASAHYVPIAPDPHHAGEEFRSRLNSLPCGDGFNVVHSCNGLLLFTHVTKGVYQCQYYVWNPATSELVDLPMLGSRRVERMDSALVYNPCDSPHYKVLRFTLLQPNRADIRVDVYSSKAGSWSNFSVPGEFPVSLRFWLPIPVFHKGALYFLGSRRQNLIHFDAEKESFNLVEILKKKYSFARLPCLGDSRGHLYYAVELIQIPGLSIYMLNDLDATWRLMYKINTKINVLSRSNLLAFHPESEVIYLTTHGKILSYHPCSGDVEKVHIFQRYPNLDWATVFFVIPCLESLDPPGGKLINSFNLEKPSGRQTHFSEITSSSRGPRRNATIPISHDLYEAWVKNLAVSWPSVPSTNLNEQVVSLPNTSLEENHDSAETLGKRCVSQPTPVNCGNTNRGKSIEEDFHAPTASRVTCPASDRQTHFSEITSSSRGPRRNATIPIFSHDLSEAWVNNLVISRPSVPSTNLNEQVASLPNASLEENHDSAETLGKRCVSQPTPVYCGNTNRGKSIEEDFHDPSASRVTCPATCLQYHDTLTLGSSREPQFDDVDPTFDYGLQVAIEASLQTPTTVASSNLINQVVSSAYLSPEENHDSAETSDKRRVRQPAKLEDFLSQLKSNALMPFLRSIVIERSDTELAEEWADVCSQVLGITSYLSLAKAEVKPEKLASRLDNLKALNNSFDCSALIRCFDCLMDYVQIIEGNNLDTINSDLQRGYLTTSRLHEQKKIKNAKKATLVDTAAAEVTEKIAALELKMQSTRDDIMELRKCLSMKEAKLSSMQTSLEIEKQKEAALVDEKTLLAIEQTALELEGKELEDYRVKISAEAKFSMEKIRNLVKQLILSLSKFDLMGSSFPWKKE